MTQKENFFFDPLKKDSEHSSLNEDALKFNVKEAQSVTVTIRKLDTFLSEKGINSPIFVLKIDTEGFDPIALKGAQNVLSNKYWIIYSLLRKKSV